MKKALLLIAIIAMCGTSGVQAQHRHRGHGWGQRMIEKKQQQLPQAPAFLKKRRQSGCVVALERAHQT